jgi:hypothetical protein
VSPESLAARPGEPRRSWWVDLAAVTAGVVLIHLALIRPFPIVYGGDTIIRLVNPRGVLSYQLPLFGWLLGAARLVHEGPAAVWALMALLGAAGGAGVYALTRELSGTRRAAAAAGLLYGTNPFLLYYGRVPYQEPLLATAVVWGFFFLARSALAGSGIAIAAASLTRYEGWIAAAAAALYAALREISWRRAAAAVGIFGAVPALWIGLHRGLSPAGTFVLSTDLSLARLHRPYFIVKSAVWWTGPFVSVLAAAGLCFVLSQLRRRSAAPYGLVLGFLAALLAALVVSGHGIAPDPERFVTEREAYLPVVFLTLFAGVGAAALLGALDRLAAAAARSARVLAVGALVLAAGDGLTAGIERIASANADPELRTDYEVARFLAEKGSGAVVFARPLPRREIESYLERAERSGGPQARRRAEELLAGIETTPFDYQRIVAYSWLPKERIVSSETLGRTDPRALERLLRDRRIGYVVVFSDYEAVTPEERTLAAALTAGRAVELEIGRGGKRVAIYAAGGL